MGGGDGFTTVWIQLMSQNYTVKHGLKSKFHIMSILLE